MVLLLFSLWFEHKSMFLRGHLCKISPFQPVGLKAPVSRRVDSWAPCRCQWAKEVDAVRNEWSSYIKIATKQALFVLELPLKSIEINENGLLRYITIIRLIWKITKTAIDMRFSMVMWGRYYKISYNYYTSFDVLFPWNWSGEKKNSLINMKRKKEFARRKKNRWYLVND